jgi:hypothetical protein
MNRRSDRSMKEAESQLHQLVQQACSHPPGSAERQKNLTKIIRLIKNRLWKESTLYYEDALQQTWVYFCHNICEGNTGEPYNPRRSTVVTWLNHYLKRRLQDFYIDAQKQQAKTVPPQGITSRSGEVEETVDPVDNIEATPDVPPMLEEVRKLVETDLGGELRRTYISGHPHVTAQVLILRRLPPETSWKALAQELGLSVSTLSSFYQRQCLPRLRKFAESEGYI